MGRVYAGILGPLAVAVTICRGWLAGLRRRGRHPHLGIALYLALFAVVGAILGHLAQTTIDESVRAKLEQQLTHRAQVGNAEAV